MASDLLKKEYEKLSIQKYEIEIKYKQQTDILRDIEESYSKLLAKSNENEIALHQTIHQMKSTMGDDKKAIKKYKKTVAEQIQFLCKEYGAKLSYGF